MHTTLTAFVPAHKQTNPQHAPGQIVNPVNPLGFVDQTLGDYIRRKDGISKAFEAVAAEKKKLSFEEWLHHRFPTGVDGYVGMLNVGDLEQCWKAAQENM